MKNIFIFTILLFSMLKGIVMADSLRVVASIKPIHSIVSYIMHGVGKPSLLVKNNSSPHDYSLRPSDIIMLENADIIFWIGPNMETFLEKPLTSLNKTSNVIILSNCSNLHKILLYKRDKKLLKSYQHEKDINNYIYDMHLWLDPVNAKHMANVIAMELIKRDPNNQKKYEKNKQDFLTKLDKLDNSLSELLYSVQGKKIVVFHGAYRYFEHRYRINIIESIMPKSVLPGAKSFQRIKNLITSEDVSCVFYEPEFDPKMIRSITDGTDVAVAMLDPEGILLPAGPDLYFKLMTNLATSLKKNCL
ncbi:zinc ABC transporter substrate-binding protein [Candidatus Liberibacter americanus]|uniref:High-affinity zinc uptake system protein ZnuA n=1 Tax=Candidatus Liberibacter americanus str. Sao Paulo TaxID=1261131 RepID=U6B4Q7_9HYPH|nr:zinc ABC transporter substrate-binding protein [Candidatus Liberibacter americanus]AHA27608.1 Zinc ABC transporter, periplasmic-binding protein ZnuA [Candidatus Liberibacter americanus str. Sao Paulo]EMS36316.1 zinc uptake ABC transporter [Candidatus Liberibacter americanus PW_SP]